MIIRKSCFKAQSFRKRKSCCKMKMLHVGFTVIPFDDLMGCGSLVEPRTEATCGSYSFKIYLKQWVQGAGPVRLAHITETE